MNLRNGLQNLLTGEVQCFIHGAGPGKVFISKLLEKSQSQKQKQGGKNTDVQKGWPKCEGCLCVCVCFFLGGAGEAKLKFSKV